MLKIDRYSNDLIYQTLYQLKSILILATIVSYLLPYLKQGYQIKQIFDVTLNSWGTFSCMLSNSKILWVLFGGYLLLISDIPFLSKRVSYEIVRSTQRQIMVSRIRYLMKITLLYLLFIFLVTCIMNGSFDFSIVNWDKLHFSYALNIVVDGIEMDVPVKIVQGYTPLEAFLTSSLLCYLVFVWFGMLTLLLSMHFPFPKTILTLNCIWGGFDMAIDEMGLGYRWYAFSPLSFARLSILEESRENFFYPTTQRIIVTLLILIFIISISCILTPAYRSFEKLSKQ